MTTALIFRPAKTAMQSGRAKTKAWCLEFEAEAARRIDPLMGWTSVDETAAGQLRLFFDDQETAVAYAERHNIPYRVAKEHSPRPSQKAYSDNFAFKRRAPWTH